ncbi:hypothetical protein HRbin20_01517 [bacterium HR20]|nr:hypothetical protein HRbin20_01517 [bacterium HR20]
MLPTTVSRCTSCDHAPTPTSNKRNATISILLRLWTLICLTPRTPNDHVRRRTVRHAGTFPPAKGTDNARCTCHHRTLPKNGTSPHVLPQITQQIRPNQEKHPANHPLAATRAHTVSHCWCPDGRWICSQVRANSCKSRVPSCVPIVQLPPCVAVVGRDGTCRHPSLRGGLP